MDNIYGKTITELEEYFLSHDEKKFKAIQVYEWLYQKKINDFADMSNIKKSVIDLLKQDFTLDKLKLVKVEEDIEVNKYLFSLNDRELVESVLMRHDYGNSICIFSNFYLRSNKTTIRILCLSICCTITNY